MLNSRGTAGATMSSKAAAYLQTSTSFAQLVAATAPFSSSLLTDCRAVVMPAIHDHEGHYQLSQLRQIFTLLSCFAGLN